MLRFGDIFAGLRDSVGDRELRSRYIVPSQCPLRSSGRPRLIASILLWVSLWRSDELSTSVSKLSAQREWRKRMRAAGLEQVTVWVPRQYCEKLKAFADNLKEGIKPRAASKRVFGTRRPRRPL